MSAVRRVESGELSARQIAEEIGVTAGTVNRWRRKWRAGTLGESQARTKDGDLRQRYGTAPWPKTDYSDLFPKIDTTALFPKTDYSDLFPKIDTTALFPKTDYSDLFPKIDTTALFPKIDYSDLFPKIDTTALFPKIDYRALFSKPDYTSIFPRIDYEKLLPRPDFSELRDWARELRRRWWPPNWPAEVPSFEVLNEILNEDGIPLVWVPRQSIVEALFAAKDRRERVEILLNERSAVTRDCQEATAKMTHPRTSGSKPLAFAAIKALSDGHDEAAQALAVVVTESAVQTALAKSYSKISHEVRIDAAEIGLRALRYRAALAPVASFYTPYYPSTGEKPSALSRHVSVHYAESDHYTSANSLLSVLLMTSVLLALDDYWSRVQPGGETEEVMTL
ncbi:helix-turn-helix domain-containing protein [Aeromicrobium tamlense]|uniref:Helix-turn-helix domain-containing protein n=1 Tax=Aeromicrobium tamlense TaxID=375541 RepID=A0A8I0KLC9_9ACTN|nr:helix-turn-helix domain-containing protein [Aeromicrobium tamlense]MBD1269933.1 helix-turn-helix domain-containing protein [Aeromicrobium tamlense]